MNIILVQDKELTGNCFVLDKADVRYRHIKKVLKLSVGACFKVGIINGMKGFAEIITFSDERLVAIFVACVDPVPLYPVRLILGFPRPIQLRRIIRDVSGLGVEAVYLIGTELGEKSYMKADVAKKSVIERLFIDGCSQAGDTFIPKIYRADSVAALFSCYGTDSTLLTEYTVKAVLDVPSDAGAPSQREGGDFPVMALPSISTTIPLTCLAWDKCRPLLLAVGNERGWSNAERTIFAENGFTAYNMGARVLRTETAVAAAVSVCLALAGCWN